MPFLAYSAVLRRGVRVYIGVGSFHFLRTTRLQVCRFNFWPTRPNLPSHNSLGQAITHLCSDQLSLLPLVGRETSTNFTWLKALWRGGEGGNTVWWRQPDPGVYHVDHNKLIANC
jgi:hypothetical protein